MIYRIKHESEINKYESKIQDLSQKHETEIRILKLQHKLELEKKKSEIKDF
jgi:hypothetical protein